MSNPCKGSQKLKQALPFYCKCMEQYGWFFCRTVSLLRRIFNYFMSIFTLFFKINLFTSSSTIWAKEEQDNKAGLKDKILFGFLIETAFSRPVYQEKHLFAYQLWRCNRLEHRRNGSNLFSQPLSHIFLPFLKGQCTTLILYADCWRSQHDWLLENVA